MKHKLDYFHPEERPPFENWAVLRGLFVAFLIFLAVFRIGMGIASAIEGRLLGRHFRYELVTWYERLGAIGESVFEATLCLGFAWWIRPKRRKAKGNFVAEVKNGMRF